MKELICSTVSSAWSRISSCCCCESSSTPSEEKKVDPAKVAAVLSASSPEVQELLGRVKLGGIPSVSTTTSIEAAQPIAVGSPAIEHSVWVKNWGPYPDPKNLPPGVNTINIFEGKLNYVGGKWTIDGLVWTPAQRTAYINACNAGGISVKVSLGGAGGQGIYNNTWDQLTDSNLQAVAQGLVDFCEQNGINGVDFDYEEQKSSQQRKQVGQLIKFFKETNPSLQASVCTCAGNEGPTYIWPTYLKEILDQTLGSDGKTLVDRVYVMSYDYGMGSSAATLAADERFMLNWISFLQPYGIDPAHISLGFDTTEPAYFLSPTDRAQLVHFAYENGLSTCVWDQMDYNEGAGTSWVFANYCPAPKLGWWWNLLGLC